MKNKKLVLSSLIIVCVVFISATYYFNKSNKEEIINSTKNVNQAPYVRDYSVSFGENKSNITVVEFLDPQCISCAIYYPLMSSIFKEYFQDIKLVYRYLPNHKYSIYMIKILEAARLQNKYNQTLNVIFKYLQSWANPNNPQPELIWNYLKETSLDIKKLKKDFLSINIDNIIKQDLKDFKTLKIVGTPTIFVNGKKVEDLTQKALRDAIEKEIMER